MAGKSPKSPQLIGIIETCWNSREYILRQLMPNKVVSFEHVGEHLRVYKKITMEVIAFPGLPLSIQIAVSRS